MRAPTWTGDATGARGREMAGRGGGPWADRRQGKEQEQEQGRRRCHRLPADVGVQAVSGEASGTGGQERPPPHRGLDGLGFEPYKPWKASGASVPGSPFASPSVLVPVSASASASPSASAASASASASWGWASSSASLRLCDGFTSDCGGDGEEVSAMGSLFFMFF